MQFDVDMSMLAGLPWQVILVSAMTLTVLASVDCLLTAVVADEETGERHDASKELVAQGIGQAVAGLLGGIGGGGTKGSTLVAAKTGGRRWAAFVSSMTFVFLILFLGPVGEVLPISALAGVIIYVGVSLLEWNMLHWLRRAQRVWMASSPCWWSHHACLRPHGRGGGGGGRGRPAFCEAASARAGHPCARHAVKERRSLHYRSEEERRLLDEHGARIVYIELRGNLFFGTVDRLVYGADARPQPARVDDSQYAARAVDGPVRDQLVPPDGTSGWTHTAGECSIRMCARAA